MPDTSQNGATNDTRSVMSLARLCDMRLSPQVMAPPTQGRWWRSRVCVICVLAD